MIENYLSILEDSLVKKKEVLRRILEVNEAQTEILKAESVDMEHFDQSVDEKDLYIKELTTLDEGFENLYDKVKQELIGNQTKYAIQIRKLQELISEITERSVSIQAQEERNRTLVEAFFRKERNSLGKSRKNSKAAYGYYQNMSRSAITESFFLDKKK